MTKEKPAILLMWSGGISSTALLLNLLSSRDYKEYDILVHHLHIRDLRNKALAEANACKDVIEYVRTKKKYKQFYFSESNHESQFLAPPRYSKTILDLDYASFVAANMVTGDPSIQKVFMGSTKTDIDENDAYRPLITKASKLFLTASELYDHHPDLSMEFPLANSTLSRVYRNTPQTIRKKTFSCVMPTYEDDGVAVACGECFKCKYAKDARIPL